MMYQLYLLVVWVHICTAPEQLPGSYVPSTDLLWRTRPSRSENTHDDVLAALEKEINLNSNVDHEQAEEMPVGLKGGQMELSIFGEI